MSSPVTTLDPREISAATQSVIDIYTNIHQFPELSFQEFATAKKIAELLDSWHVSHQRCTPTGVLAIINNGSGPTIAFRADIDALPVKEKTGVDFQSQVLATIPSGEGTKTVPVMHACGHDVHIASALGTIRFLLDHRDLWQGTVEFIFQPAEELGSGAQKMVDAGLWDLLPTPQLVLGQHVGPFQMRSIALNDGPLLAQSDSLKVTVLGKGAHASRPEDGIDTIVLAAHMIVRLQTIVSREISAFDKAVITIGTINGGTKENIISDSAEFTINIRTYGTLYRDKIFPAITRILSAEADASGAPQPIITPTTSFTSVNNDPPIARFLTEHFTHTFGIDHTIANYSVMGSEDFGVLAQAIDVPYVFWFHGAYNPTFIADRINAGLPLPSNHQPDFIPHTPADAISTGIEAAVVAIINGAQAVH